MTTKRIKDLTTAVPAGTEFLVFDSAVGGSRKATIDDVIAATDVGPSDGSVPGSLTARVYAVESEHTATAADPTVTSDAAHGFAAGAVWLNTTSGVLWVCKDATTGAAVWTLTYQFGTSGSVACVGNDSRLSNSRAASSVSTAVLQATTAALSGALDFNANALQNALDPVNAQDVSTLNTARTTNVLAKTAAYTLLTTDARVIQVDDTAARVDLTLPDPASKRVYTIQKVAGTTGGIRLIRHGSEKIMTVAASYDLPGSTTAFSSSAPQAWLVYSDGTDWWVC